MTYITTDITLALRQLEEGSVVAIPTETVYGLAADAANSKAIEKIYELKNRPKTHPLIMHVGIDWDISVWVSSLPSYARILIEHFWPGPLTLIAKATTQVHPLITGGQNTIAIRCPQHSFTQQLLTQLKRPLVAPSANPFGKISPTTAAHVCTSFPNQDLLVLDGGRCSGGIESTILNVINPEGYQIMRQGLISEHELSTVLPSCLLHHSDNELRAPGSLKTHYQPEKKLYYFTHLSSLINSNLNISQAYLLTFNPLIFEFPQAYCFSKKFSDAAFEFYFQLRNADTSAASFIAIELPSAQSPWNSLRERILKAGFPIDPIEKEF